MDKVKLPKEVAEAIDKSVKHMEPAAIMAHMVQYSGPEAIATTPDLSHIYRSYKKNPYLIACALVNGYEVELTPKEQAIQYLIELNASGRRYSEHDAVSAIMQIVGVKDDA